MQSINHNKRIHMPSLPGMGLSILPIVWAKQTNWIGTIIYVTPKALHIQTAHEIMKICSIEAKTLVGMRQPIPLFAPVIILTPQTLKFRVYELRRITPRFMVTKSIQQGWDEVLHLSEEAERVCLIGGESTMNTRRIVR